MKPPASVRLARQAMATRFEVLLYGESEPDLRAAGEEALDEVERLESQLSLYRPASEIARVNALAARQPVRVSPAVFELLAHAQRLHQETGGAFDITIGPLVRCWGFMGGPGHLPDAGSLDAARAVVGMQHLKLDADNFSVSFDREGVMIDLGAIGKGYAIDCAVQLLRECGMTSALIHGGTSTTYALGAPPGADAWRVELPPVVGASAADFQKGMVLALRDEALSVSAIWGRSFTAGDKTYGHVIDPRSGQPVADSILAVVGLPSAAETDALSTALLVAGGGTAGAITQLRSNMRHFLAIKCGGALTASGNLGQTT